MEQYRSFDTALAFLAPPERIVYSVPSDAPQLLVQSPAPVVPATVFFPPDAQGFVLARVLDAGDTLELTWLSLTQGAAPDSPCAELEHAGALPPVHFVFPARILPSPAFSLVEDTLRVHVLTEDGYFYALSFPVANLFYAAGLGADESFSEEHRVLALDGHVPVLMHGSGVGKAVIGCADGFAVSLEMMQDGTYEETELKSTNAFSVRSLLPSFSTRSQSASASTSSPAQLVSLASTSAHDQASFAFGVSRDRKLKIWNLDTGVCLRAIDFPRPATTSTDVEIVRGRETDSPAPNGKGGKKGPILLPPTPSSYVKVIQGDATSSFDAYLLLYVTASSGSPPAFFLYGIQSDAAGNVSELVPAGEQRCASGAAVLVDFDVVRFDDKLGRGSGWTLWTVWEEGGEAEVRFVPLDGQEIQFSEEEDVEWVKVARGAVSVAGWNASHFDELLQDPLARVTEVFATHISHPGRYSQVTLETALEGYEESTLAELDPRHRPEAFSFEYESVMDRIFAIVGCTVHLETSPQTGAALIDAFNKRLKVEWLKFVAMCNESRAAALFPTTIACSGPRGLIMVVTRDAVTVPVVQDTVLAMQRLETDDFALADFMGLLPEALELSYPALSPQAIRHDIFAIQVIITQLNSQLPLAVSAALERQLLVTVRSPFTADVEAIAGDLYQIIQSQIDEDLLSILSEQLALLLTPEASFHALWALLISSELVHPVEDAGTKAAISDLTSTLLADQLSNAIEARYQLAKGLATLLLFIHGEEQSSFVPQLSSLTNSVLATFHTLASLRWITLQDAPLELELPAQESDDSILERFGEMKVSASGQTGSSSTPSVSLLNSLIRDRHSPSLSLGHPLPLSFTHAASSFLASTGLVSQKRLVINSPAEVVFAHRLTELVLYSLALDFVEMYPQGAGMLYVNGLALLGLDRFEEAANSFMRAAPAFYEQHTRLDETTGLSLVLPLSIANSLPHYYAHVVSLFIEPAVDLALIKFASLAIEAFSGAPAPEAMESDATEAEAETRDLWLTLFKSYCNLGMFEDAYSTLMGTPHPAQKSPCLAHLISTMSEAQPSQCALLLSFSFIGLQGELERNLSFRARNSDPLAGAMRGGAVDWHKVLYSYHVKRGDYKSAGSTMFQQARRIGLLASLASVGPTRGGERESADFQTLATLQCQSYLVSINALALVQEKSGEPWIAVAAEEEPGHAGKRRRITYHIPDDEYETPTASHPLEILQLSDIRREYTLLLSRLLLSPDFPELARSNFSLEASSIISLFSQTSSFDTAFSTALTLDVDMSSLFETLTGKCISLALNTASDSDSSNWLLMSSSRPPVTLSGKPVSLPKQAWSLLQLHLTRHDDPSTLVYHRVALRKCLEMDRKGALQTWIIDAFLKQDEGALLRTLVEFGRLEEAFQVSLRIISSSSPALLDTTIMSSLPYSLFDTLLALTPAGTPELEGSKLATQQAELRKALEGRIGSVETVQRTALRAGR